MRDTDLRETCADKTTLLLMGYFFIDKTMHLLVRMNWIISQRIQRYHDEHTDCARFVQDRWFLPRLLRNRKAHSENGNSSQMNLDGWVEYLKAVDEPARDTEFVLPLAEKFSENGFQYLEDLQFLSEDDAKSLAKGTEGKVTPLVSFAVRALRRAQSVMGTVASSTANREVEKGKRRALRKEPDRDARLKELGLDSLTMDLRPSQEELNWMQAAVEEAEDLSFIAFSS